MTPGALVRLPPRFLLPFRLPPPEWLSIYPGTCKRLLIGDHMAHVLGSLVANPPTAQFTVPKSKVVPISIQPPWSVGSLLLRLICRGDFPRSSYSVAIKFQRGKC